MFFESLPSFEKLIKSVSDTDYQVDALIPVYDKVLLEYSWFNEWLAQFEYTYGVEAGEGLKELRSFPMHMENIIQLVGHKSAKNLAFISIGGGSVGDFVGFIASIYKRGAALIHIPTTWLAAIDSSHGGKTALNVMGIKNQVGTFYPAQVHFICSQFLRNLPHKELQSAYGELVKMALIKGGKFSENLEGYSGSLNDSLWHFLSYAIESKLEIVANDPFEITGERQILNLGHTLGHIYESQCEMSHGMAVLFGIKFSLEWSRHREYLSQSGFNEAMTLVEKYFPIPKLEELSHKKILEGLLRDKKSEGSSIRFIFIHGVGNVIRELVDPKEFLEECQRQGVCQ